MQPLILYHFCIFFFFFRAEQQLVFVHFFCKEGQRSDKSDVTYKDKGDALPRSTYHKNYF